ncbi:Protein of uncharacterised function (DUF2627) [Chlamydia abortus]|uniref:DUF2627 domain-containing protein n=1 Tax=Paenibacillus residui TaxID=629724 RepID=A0ABW3DHM9_9BACL|nr:MULTISPECIES: DUF2627 domain-containing protein [Paenibacillaceae]SHE11129.1 Protein of uncharacterised function (DUF2627) [Chlamydia abortus]
MSDKNPSSASRMIAALLLVIPGIGATYGFLLMKNTIFEQFDPQVSFAWGKFLLGLLLFIVGVGFIAGWIFFRDQKRNYVAPRFKKKRTR